MNEALRAYILSQCEQRRIDIFSKKHGINRNAATRFAHGKHHSVTLAAYESIIREMILAGKFDIKAWLKNGA